MAALQNFVNKYIWNTEKRGIGLGDGVSNWQDFVGFLFGGLSSSSESGETVTVERGTAIDTSFSCINVASQDVAKLLPSVRQDTPKGKIIIRNDIHRLIHTRPNFYTSAFNFWYNIVFNMLSWGNGYAFIKRDARMRPIELTILPPKEVEALIVEGDIFYRFGSNIINNEDMLHFKLYSFDGVTGISPIIHNANTFGYRLKQEKYSSKVLGTKPPGFLSSDQPLSLTQQQENAKEWKRRTTGDNIGSTPVLAGGMKYNQLMIPPEEGQMIESSNLSDERICGIYRMPQAKIQKLNHSTYSNVEQQDLSYAKDTLHPIIRVLEQEMDYKLFTEQEKQSNTPPYTKFNIKAILHGDIKTQVEYYKFLRSFGLASANDILALEDLPPLKGEQGDMVVIQGAFVPLDQLKDFYNKASGVGDDQRNLGFQINELKEHIDRLEIQNKSE